MGVGLIEWENARKRLARCGEALAGDEKTKCSSLLMLLGGHALTRKMCSSLKLQHGRGLKSHHVIQRMLVDIEFWEQEWQQTKQEPKEANVAVQEEAAVVQAQAFVAASSQAKQGGAAGAGEARAAGRQQWQKSKGGIM